MAYSDIKDPSAHFQATVYTGNNTAGNVITNTGNSDLKPDLIFSSYRTSPPYTNHRCIIDSTRGRRAILESDTTAAEVLSADNANVDLQSINTDGFTVGQVNSTASLNAGNTSTVAWQWKANGGTTATNNDGSITTTTQVNSDAGFSIVTWAGGGTGSLGHGLGVVPDMWIVKNRDYAVSWAVGFSDSSILGGTSNYLSLNTTSATLTYNNLWGSSPVNSSTITMAGDRSVNISGNDYVAYFFKAKQGYSKFGNYEGNGNANGSFIYTGFKPAFVMLKPSSAADNWIIVDNKRDPNNPAEQRLFPDISAAEGTGYEVCDMLSNGFKMRATSTSWNGSGRTYIYMAFAEQPFVTSTGIPATAR